MFTRWWEFLIKSQVKVSVSILLVVFVTQWARPALCTLTWAWGQGRSCRTISGPALLTIVYYGQAALSLPSLPLKTLLSLPLQTSQKCLPEVNRNLSSDFSSQITIFLYQVQRRGNLREKMEYLGSWMGRFSGRKTTTTISQWTFTK